MERVAGVRLGLAVSAAELGEGRREPRPCLDARPFAIGLDRGRVAREVGARDEPHRLDEGEAVGCAPLRLLPAAEHLVEALPVHLDPATLEETPWPPPR